MRALPGKRFCLVRHNPSLPLTAQPFQRSATEYRRPIFGSIHSAPSLFSIPYFVVRLRLLRLAVPLCARGPERRASRNTFCETLPKKNRPSAVWPCDLFFRVWFLPHDLDGAMRVSGDGVRNRAEQEALPSVVAVRTEHDQIGVPFFGLV